MTRKTSALTLLAALALPGLAVAHPGHGAESGFAQGFGHPFGGVDHVALLLAAGALLAWIRGAGRVALLAGLFSLLTFAHRDWILPGAAGWGFVAGFLVASTMLVGAGLAAASIVRRRRSVVRARAPRSAISPAGGSPAHPSTSSR
ncbi:MAG TPA: HupE/UreJ family protein [Steroidobacteraceae bacterium]|nr:HupE/UreJ family protein [Steroidobacteraceae bacterium]